MIRKASVIFIALVVAVSAILSVALPALADDSNILELYPSNGSEIYKKPDYFTVNPGGASEIVYELDGKFLGKGDGYGRIAVADLSYGKHTVKATAVVPGGTAITEESTFVYENATVELSQFQDFNNLGGSVDNLSADFYLVNTDNADFTIVQGASGEPGDYAVKLTRKSNSGSPYIASKPFQNYAKGKVEISFDIKLNTEKEALRVLNTSLWCNSNVIVNNGIWTGTDIPATTEWTNVKMNLDYDSKKISLAINGRSVVTNADFGTESGFKDEVFRLNTVTPYNVSGAGFALDNFFAECIIPAKVAERAVYVSDDEEHPLEGDIPKDAGKLRIYLASGLKSIGADKITLATAYGLNTEIKSVNYDSSAKTVDIVPAVPLEEGTEYVLSMDSSLKLESGAAIGSDYEIRFKTANTYANTNVSFRLGDRALATASQIEYGDALSADISVTNLTSDALTMTYFLTLRRGGTLVAVSAEEVNLGANGQTDFVLTLPKIGEYYGDYEVYLFNCTDFSDISAVENFTYMR